MFGSVMGVFLLQYLADGAGLQDSGFGFPIFSPVSSGSVLIGLVHIVGFFMLAVLCFVVGVGLCLRGFESKPDNTRKLEPTADSHVPQRRDLDC